MVLYTNGLKNTLKSLLSPLLLITLPPKKATELLYFCTGTIPFNIEVFEIHKNI